MELILSGEKMDIQITEALYSDYAAARCDSLQLFLNDENREIRKMYEMRKGTALQLDTDEISTGEMYISELSYLGAAIYVKALSMPCRCFKERTFYRSKLSFEEMVKEIQAETGLKLKMIDTLDYFYIDITRTKENPIKYLNSRLQLEGFQLKIKDNTLIVYDERKQEEKEAVVTYSEADFVREPRYTTKDAHLVSTIENMYKPQEGRIIHSIVSSGLEGKNLQTNIAVSSISESERITKSIMREANKYEFMITGTVEGLLRRAGQVVNIECDIPDFAGKNYIYQITHDLIGKKQDLKMRKIISGDY